MDFSECVALLRMSGHQSTFPVVNTAERVPCVSEPGTVTAAFVAKYVEGMDVLDTDVVNVVPLLEELASARTSAPITADDVDKAIKRVESVYRNAYRHERNFLPRCLKTLNGPDYLLVPSHVVVEAVEREKAMAGMVHGWGVCDPPEHAIAHRVLVSAGCDRRHLPTYKPLPQCQRGRLMHAWAGACAQLGWECYQPVNDVKASARVEKDLDALRTSKPC